MRVTATSCHRTATAILAILLVGSTDSTLSQTLRQYSVRPERFGARSMSNGDATIADAHDASSMYFNPAALGFIQHTSPVANSRLDSNSSALSSGIAVPFRIGSEQIIAVGLVTNYYGATLSKPDFVCYGFDLAFASKIISTLSGGAILNLRYGSTVEGSFKSGLLIASGSFGLLYSPNPGISYAIAYRGVGSGMLFSQNKDSRFVQSERELPQSVESGLTFRYPSSSKRPIVVLSMAIEKSLADSRGKNKAGLEISPFDFISFRMGLITNDPTTLFRTGVGTNLLGFRLDYAICPNSSTGSEQQLSISVPLVE